MNYTTMVLYKATNLTLRVYGYNITFEYKNKSVLF